jgi:DNA-binding transcriptional ArsR family regulator
MNTGLDHTFAALADPTRRAILARLASGEASVGELARPHRISLPAISRHLKVLEQSGLIVRRREGKERRCRLDPRPLQEAADFLAFYREFWSRSLDRLARHLETQQRRPRHARRPKRR